MINAACLSLVVILLKDVKEELPGSPSTYRAYIRAYTPHMMRAHRSSMIVLSPGLRGPQLWWRVEVDANSPLSLLAVALERAVARHLRRCEARKAPENDEEMHDRSGGWERIQNKI